VYLPFVPTSRLWFYNFFNLSRAVLALVLQQVQLLRAALGVYNANMLSFMEKYPIHPHIGVDLHRVVVHQVAFPHRPLVLVPEHHVTEVSSRMGGGGAVRPISMAPKWSRVLRHADSSAEV
jgi:hypothetical protein